MRDRTPSLTAKLNVEQEVAVKKAKEDQAARRMTKAKSQTLKSARRSRLVYSDDGVSLQTQSCSNLLICMVVGILD